MKLYICQKSISFTHKCNKEYCEFTCTFPERIKTDSKSPIQKQVDWQNINRAYTESIIHVIPMGLTSWELVAIIILYTIIFAILMIFMELRLRVLHRHHAQKIRPVDDAGLVEIDRKLRFFVHSLLLATYVLSVSLIIIIV